MGVGVLAELVSVEIVVGMLERRHRKPPCDESRDHLGDERRLAGAAPAGEADDAHAGNIQYGRFGSLRRLHLALRRLRDVALSGLLLEPEAVMLLCPID